MHAGTPLTDEDRWPWLRAIAAEIDAMRARGESAVVACSALKRAYRDILIGERADVVLVYLQGSKELIAHGVVARHGHFMPPALLDSQFATLEEPGEDEHPIVVSIDAPPDAIVDAVVRQLKERARMSGEFAIYPSLRDRVVFITGGASGIGAEHVAQFAAQGAKVAFVDIADDAAQALVGRHRGGRAPGAALPALRPEGHRRVAGGDCRGRATAGADHRAGEQRGERPAAQVRGRDRRVLGRAAGDQSAASVLRHPGSGADDARGGRRVDHQFRFGELAFAAGRHAGLHDGEGRGGGPDARHGARSGAGQDSRQHGDPRLDHDRAADHAVADAGG